ncbi:hypothetical protein DFJ77DRAFT_46390 [Powellomyces hirtus]|nr:hypothetical protein DFJ77DRAFT_46390 [Powellomyces hirtus]
MSRCAKMRKHAFLLATLSKMVQMTKGRQFHVRQSVIYDVVIFQGCYLCGGGRGMSRCVKARRNRISTHHSLKNGPNNERKTVLYSRGSDVRCGNIARLVSVQGWKEYKQMCKKPSKNVKSNNSVNTCPINERKTVLNSPGPALR